MELSDVQPPPEYAKFRAAAEARVRDRLVATHHPRPSDVLGPITIALIRYRVPFFAIATDKGGPALQPVGGIDRETFIELLEVRGCTLGEALAKAKTPTTRAAVENLVTEVTIVEQKRRVLGPLLAGQLTGAEVNAVTAEMDAEIRSTVLATPLSAIVRVNGGVLAPVLQHLINTTYEHLCHWYAGKPHITTRELAALDPDNPVVRKRAHYPRELLVDIADLVTGHWGQVLGRIEPKDVKSCLQRRLRPPDPTG